MKYKVYADFKSKGKTVRFEAECGDLVDAYEHLEAIIDSPLVTSSDKQSMKCEEMANLVRLFRGDLIKRDSYGYGYERIEEA